MSENISYTDNGEHTIPVEEFYLLLSKDLYERPEYHEILAHSAVPRTHTMLEWKVKESNKDIFTSEQQYAIFVYAYKTEESQ